MDAFETSVGYRSLLPPLSLPERQALEDLPEGQVREIAKDMFDATVAEELRSSGRWHWQLEIREVVEQVADTLSVGVQERYELLRAALLSYYAEQYRTPSARAYRAYLRGKKKAGTVPIPGLLLSWRDFADGSKPALYYLDERITDRDPHDPDCPCGLCNDANHIALGVSFYRLDPEGLQYYQEQLRGTDEVSFSDWCSEQESQATIYGPGEEAAIGNALAFARKEGWLVANHAQHSPHLAPLVEALRMLVGDDGYLTQHGVCECANDALQNEEVCRICYAWLVFDVLELSLHPVVRRQ
jgi:hypothetical protein